MITINDVAKKSGVAKSTVSNALTNKKYVSPKLKEKIKEACEELDFQPNFYASTLACGKTNIIALVLEEDSNENFRAFYSDLIVSCLQTLAKRGKSLLIYSGLNKNSVLTMLKRDKAPIDGAIVMTPLIDDLRIAQLEKQRIPCVILGHPDDKLKINYVDLNNAKMVSDVTDRLYSQGYRKFCLINSERSKTISVDRAKGFNEMLAGKNDACGYVVYTRNSSKQEGKLCVAPYLMRGTAFIASDGRIAQGIFEAAAEKGFVLDKDIKIYSLGEDELDECVKWEYAVQDYKKLGSIASKILLDEIAGDTQIKHIFTEYYKI